MTEKTTPLLFLYLHTIFPGAFRLYLPSEQIPRWNFTFQGVKHNLVWSWPHFIRRVSPLLILGSYLSVFVTAIAFFGKEVENAGVLDAEGNKVYKAHLDPTRDQVDKELGRWYLPVTGATCSATALSGFVGRGVLMAFRRHHGPLQHQSLRCITLVYLIIGLSGIALTDSRLPILLSRAPSKYHPAFIGRGVSEHYFQNFLAWHQVLSYMLLVEGVLQLLGHAIMIFHPGVLRVPIRWEPTIPKRPFARSYRLADIPLDERFPLGRGLVATDFAAQEAWLANRGIPNHAFPAEPDPGGGSDNETSYREEDTATASGMCFNDSTRYLTRGRQRLVKALRYSLALVFCTFIIQVTRLGLLTQAAGESCGSSCQYLLIYWVFDLSWFGIIIYLACRRVPNRSDPADPDKRFQRIIFGTIIVALSIFVFNCVAFAFLAATIGPLVEFYEWSSVAVMTTGFAVLTFLVFTTLVIWNLVPFFYQASGGGIFTKHRN